MRKNIVITTNLTAYENDFLDLVKAFGGYFSLQEGGTEINLSMTEIYAEADIKKTIKITSQLLKQPLEKSMIVSVKLSALKAKSMEKRFCKVVLYDALSLISGESLPYGSLTGIRPTKLFKETEMKGVDAEDFFINTLRVSPQKTKLIKTITCNQQKFFNEDDLAVDVFINIPICVSRCVYCSFLSAELSKIKKLVTPYVDLLVEEIRETKRLIKELSFSVRSVYIGGGTPTSLDEINFARVLNECDFGVMEFTVEAGRPDTISKEKLDIMAAAGVTRISINPQTFNQKTLDLIGRKHSVEQIFEVYAMAKKYPFLINMDLIAMLPEETFEDFCNSVDTTIALDPDNITVHTLALKRGSKLAEQNYDNIDESLPQKMVDYSLEKIEAAGYFPYYMYKQKYMSGNLENVGYAKPQAECVYNIDIMEETNTIVACGAGGISKSVNHSNHLIERLANPKGLDVYLARQGRISEDKKEFFTKFAQSLK